jgi:hypothetical protein
MKKIHVEMKSWFTSNKKAERAAALQELSGLLQGRASTLEPIPLEAVKLCSENNRRRIFRVSNMESVPFGKKTLDLGGGAKFYAAFMGNTLDSYRIRKFATFSRSGKQYLLFQQTTDYSNVVALVDLDTMVKYRLRSMAQVKLFFKIQEMDIKDVPLMVNDQYVTRNKVLNGLLRKRMGL